MQQYFDISSGSGTLTVFHTDDIVSFDVEHFGGFRVPDDELLEFLNSEEKALVVTENLSERHPELAEKRPNMYPDDDVYRGEIKRAESGGLELFIDGEQRQVTVTLSAEQAETLTDSITVGEVERYENGQYPVEFVNQNGERDRAEHN